MDSDSAVYANAFVDEDTSSNGTVNITFPWRSRKINVSNDSASASFTVSLRTGNSMNHTLKAGETLELNFLSDGVTVISTVAVSYRVWAFS